MCDWSNGLRHQATNLGIGVRVFYRTCDGKPHALQGLTAGETAISSGSSKVEHWSEEPRVAVRFRTGGL